MRYLQLRQQVLKAAREISAARMVVGTWGNVSARAEDEDLVLVTPSAKNYETMQVQDIVLVDMQGTVVEGEWKPSSELLMHLAIYQQRPDVGAVVHVHSTYAAAFAAARETIPVILEETAQVIGHEVVTAPYAPAGSSQLAANAAAALGSGWAVLLANHGLVGVGKDLTAALRVCYITEETARVAVAARGLGQVYSLSADEISQLQRGFSHYGLQKN